MRTLAISLLLLAGAWRSAPASAAQSDLTPTIYDVHFEGPGAWVSDAEVAEGCAKSTVGRTLLRFGTRVMNLGPDDLVIGDPGCPDCTTNPGAVCQDSRFVCSQALGLPHFQSAARYELLDPTGADVVVGGKRGYCFNDDQCTGGKSPVYTDCGTNQGLSVGCTDDYEPFLYCQYLDVTDVPNVMTRAFRLRVTIDTADLLPDPNRADNVTEVAIPGCGDGIVQPGEDCDPGVGAAASCCDDTCHFVPAGGSCRAATGPCDRPAECDGTDASCPANGTQPDGTSCGSGMGTCADQVCRAGTCTLERNDGAGCVIGAECFASGAADPSDPCQRCDPSAASDAWTPIQDPDPPGIQCGMQRVSIAAADATCRHRTMATLDRRLRQAGVIAARLTAARPALARRLTTRLVQVTNQMIRVTGGGCASDDLRTALGTLRDQLRAMQALQR
jgi:lysyl oxidase